MRQIRYMVAMSLDAFIAGPNGESDWITMDPDINFREIFSRFDTFLVGRRTFEAMAHAGRASTPGMQTLVFSRTLRQQDFPDVTIVADNPNETIAALRSKPGKDIWLFGGGSLFRSLLEIQLVDTIEVAVIPVLLGDGIPLLPPPSRHVKLRLVANKAFKTGIMSLEYAIEYGPVERGGGRHRSCW